MTSEPATNEQGTNEHGTNEQDAQRTVIGRGDLPGLPAGFHARRPDPARDVTALHAVCVADDIEVLGEADFSGAEVATMLAPPCARADADQWVVANPEGEVVAWGMVGRDYPGDDDVLDAYLCPGQPADVGEVLLDALLARAAEREAEIGARPGARVWMGVLVGDSRWEPLLHARGLSPQRIFARMRRALDATLPAAVVPEGITVRTFDPASDRDWRDLHRILMTAFRDHWEHHDAPYDDWRARVDSEPQRFDRWFLADDARLGPVGMCQGTIQHVENGGGWVRNLAVLREARGRGVARCLLLHVMAAFASDGLDWCGLGVDTASATGALYLYESVGMTPTYRAHVWGAPVAAV